MRGEKQGLWIKSVVAEESCEWVYMKLFYATAKMFDTIIDFFFLSNYFYMLKLSELPFISFYQNESNKAVMS